MKSELEFCMKCGEPNPPENPICKCGSRNFVFGNNFKYENKKVVCNCGCDQFKMTFHMNRNPIYTKNYQCVKCVNVIGVETYCENEYLDDSQED